MQQKVAASIREAFPHLNDDDCFSTSMGAHGEDVRLSTAAREVVPLSIECKCVEKINIWQCIEQCETNTPQMTDIDVASCLIFSRNRSKTYAVVQWDVLLSLLKRVQSTQQEGIPPRMSALIQELHGLLPANMDTTATWPSAGAACSATCGSRSSPEEENDVDAQCEVDEKNGEEVAEEEDA